MNMDDGTAPDLLSDLPLSIIEIILTLLPIRDAVRTSVLSSKWRYRWATIPELVFSDNSVRLTTDKEILEGRLINFITHALLLHEGPIRKFKICSSVLQCCPDVDQWMLFLSRNNVRELTLELGCCDEWVRVPSCLFSCKYLTHLELSRFDLDPPPTFKGFPCLKTLNLQQVFMAHGAIESLISSCPLLESLTLCYSGAWDLNIYAPNLKSLCLEGDFKKICLEETPKLEVMIITLYMNPDEVQEEHLEQSFGCTYVKFLDGVPYLRRLSGHVYFTKYLSIGIDQWRPQVTYSHLKIIELQQVSFEDINEILVVIRLITNSPNLEELHISGSPNTVAAMEASDLDFWKTECPSGTLKRLKTVMMTVFGGVPHEMEFIRFLLGISPVLEKMSIAPCTYVTKGRVDVLVELLRFQRASPLAEILFIQE